MLYHLVIASCDTQIFSEEWTSTSSIIADLEWLRQMGFPIKFGDLYICGRGHRFKIRPDLRLDYHSRHFYVSVDHGWSFVLDEQPFPLRVHTREELNQALGLNINA